MTGPASALLTVDRLVADGALQRTHLLPSVRSESLLTDAVVDPIVSHAAGELSYRVL